MIWCLTSLLDLYVVTCTLLARLINRQDMVFDESTRPVRRYLYVVTCTSLPVRRSPVRRVSVRRSPVRRVSVPRLSVHCS